MCKGVFLPVSKDKLLSLEQAPGSNLQNNFTLVLPNFSWQPPHNRPLTIFLSLCLWLMMVFKWEFYASQRATHFPFVFLWLTCLLLQGSPLKLRRVEGQLFCLLYDIITNESEIWESKVTPSRVTQPIGNGLRLNSESYMLMNCCDSRFSEFVCPKHATNPETLELWNILLACFRTNVAL